jgi:hypothetical protein
MTDERLIRKINAERDISNELLAAEGMFPAIQTPHQGYAIILEELDELWDEIKAKPGVRSQDRMRKEAVQVAAMALRFIVDVCYD